MHRFFRIAIPLLLLACEKKQQHIALEMEFNDWYVVSVPNGQMTAAYGKIRNRSNKERRLDKVEFSCAPRSELHETVVSGDRVTMGSIDSVVLAPGGLVVFQPGGKHIMMHEAMLTNLKSCDVRLALAEGRVIQFRVPIRERRS